MRKAIITLTAIVMALAIVYSGSFSLAEPAEGESGKKAENFTLENYDGEAVSLSDYKGKIVVLEWFNFDCPFVKYHYEEDNTMVRLAYKYKDKEVYWLSINTTNYATKDQNKQYAKKHNVPYPILDDTSGKVGRAYGAKTTPHMIIIDKAGKIVYDGAIDNSPLGKTSEGEELINYVDKALAEMTGGKKVSNAKTKPYGCTVKYAN